MQKDAFSREFTRFGGFSQSERFRVVVANENTAISRAKPL